MLLTHTAIKSAALALVAAKTLILQKKVFRFSFGQRHLLTRFSRGPGVMESYPSQILIKNLDSNVWNMYVCIHFKNEFEHKSHRKQTKTTYRNLFETIPKYKLKRLIKLIFIANKQTSNPKQQIAKSCIEVQENCKQITKYISIHRKRGQNSKLLNSEK